jgi:hypothetical protein
LPDPDLTTISAKPLPFGSTNIPVGSQEFKFNVKSLGIINSIQQPTSIGIETFISTDHDEYDDTIVFEGLTLKELLGRVVASKAEASKDRSVVDCSIAL